MHTEEKVWLKESNQMDQGVIEAGIGFCFVLVWPVLPWWTLVWFWLSTSTSHGLISQCVFKCRNSIHIILHKDVVNQSFNVYSNRELLAFWKHYLISTCPSPGSSYFPQDDFLLVTPSPWFWFLSLAVTQYTVLSHPKAPSINIWDQFSSCLSAPCTHS